jgi:UDPglucose 6-dehydrogenase
MMENSTGIIGLGFVGHAIQAGFEKNKIDSLYTYDIDTSKNSSCNSIAEVAQHAEIIYVCVPTPMDRDGSCDTSIVDRVVYDIVAAAPSQRIIVIKSTVPPGTTERLQTLHPFHHIVFSPEFLTEANYIEDFYNQMFMVVGACENSPTYIADLVGKNQRMGTRGFTIINTTIATTAELFKYTANTFLALKVSYANEMASIATALGVEWDALRKLILGDARLGTTHWNVPGPDGHYGYGGVCFPKDISALLAVANMYSVPTPVLAAAWMRNTTIDRPERDWEALTGRAVVN